jgi:uncharacterized alpha/beta hydrolase family protein
MTKGMKIFTIIAVVIVCIILMGVIGLYAEESDNQRKEPSSDELRDSSYPVGTHLARHCVR